jgi:hypothetical protein
MFPGGHVLIEIALRTTVIYTVVLLGVRLSGKREVGQMTPFDLTLLLLISNSVQNAMTGPELPHRRSFGHQPPLPQVGRGSAQLADSRRTDHQRAYGEGARQHR